MLRWIPTRGVKTPLYIPHSIELPEGDPYAFVFDFKNSGVLQNREQAEAVRTPFLLTHVLGYFTTLLLPTIGSFYLQVYHQHGSEQRQLLSKEMRIENVGGTARRPLILPSPYFIDAGDTITVTISNTIQAVLPQDYSQADIQVVLWGMHLKQGF